MKEDVTTVMFSTKKELLLQLIELDKSIRCLISDENIDELGVKLEKRQDIIERLEELKNSNEPEQIDSNVSEIDAIISEVKKSDKENILLVDNMRKKYRSQIKNLNQSKKKLGSYTQAGNNSDGYFVDAKK